MVDVGIEHCNDYVKRERNDGQESNLLLPWGREMRLYRRATQPTWGHLGIRYIFLMYIYGGRMSMLYKVLA